MGKAILMQSDKKKTFSGGFSAMIKTSHIETKIQIDEEVGSRF